MRRKGEEREERESINCNKLMALTPLTKTATKSMVAY